MAGKGWIKLHRKIRDNPIFNDMQLLRLWLICLTEASHSERDQIIGKQTVHLMPGEFVTGRYDIQEMYNQGLKPKEKVTGEKTIYRWLEILETNGFLTIKKTNKFSLVSIDNWAFYQEDDQQNNQHNDQQMTIKRPTNDEILTTNKNEENYKNYITTTTTPGEPERKKTLGQVYTEIYGTLAMTGPMSQFFMDLRNKGYDESFCTELLLEASECCGGGRPPVRYLQPIRDRWIREGIQSRTQAAEDKSKGEGANDGKRGQESTRRDEASRREASRGQEQFVGSAPKPVSEAVRQSINDFE